MLREGAARFSVSRHPQIWPDSISNPKRQNKRESDSRHLRDIHDTYICTSIRAVQFTMFSEALLLEYKYTSPILIPDTHRMERPPCSQLGSGVTLEHLTQLCSH